MYQKIVSFLASKMFFCLIVGLLVVQALWIALSGLYPMAFDENFHLGIIRLYAHHTSPIWTSPPPDNGALGAVARDPSYLYQYLMSFPYRFISLLTHNQAAQVIFLRFINIGLFACCLPLYRRLLLKTGASRALVHILLLLFILIPVVPLLAAQINYDNALLPLTAGALMLSVGLSDELRRYKRINMWTLGWLIVICLLGSLVKMAFLPVALGIAAYIMVQIVRTLGTGRKMWRTIGFGVTLITKRARWLLAALVLLSLGLFVERYGTNIVSYHAPVPDCAQVLTLQQCSNYGPWARDHQYAAHKAPTTHSPLSYTQQWLQAMWVRLFFAVDGPTTHFQTRGPLPMPSLAAVVLVLATLFALPAAISTIRLKYRTDVLLLFLVVSTLYLIILWLDEYKAYIRTGQPVAINGRYLLPVTPLLLAPLGLSCRTVLRRKPSVKLLLASLAVICFMWGGGALTYILRSNDAWYWPNPAARHANHAVQKVLRPVVPGSQDPTKFLFLT